MKKCLIALAILWGVALIATMSLAGYVGTSVLKDVVQDNFSLFKDGSFLGETGSTLIKESNLVKENSYNLPVQNGLPLAIDVDMADVNILKSTDGQAKVVVKEYSKNKDTYQTVHNISIGLNETVPTIKCTLDTSENGYSTDKMKNYVVLNIYLPENIGLNNLDMVADFASFDISTDLKCANLKLTSNFSNFNFSNVTVENSAKIDADYSNIEFNKLSADNLTSNFSFSNAKFGSETAFVSKADLSGSFSTITMKLERSQSGYTVNVSQDSNADIDDDFEKESNNLYKLNDGKCIVSANLDMSTLEIK
ncbi:MAG: hypothetical protein K5917_01845 [Clostridiales bacterium]|nr:hypothetical protein [Clostridiales bacterium]